MTTEVAPTALLLGTDEGAGVWFADSLLSYKVTGDQTHGQLALAEVSGRVRGLHPGVRLAGDGRDPPAPGPAPRSEGELVAAARRYGIDIDTALP
jgi:hypothetical protein